MEKILPRAVKGGWGRGRINLMWRIGERLSGLPRNINKDGRRSEGQDRRGESMVPKSRGDGQALGSQRSLYKGG